MNLPGFYFGENIPQLLTYYVPVSGGVTIAGTSPVSYSFTVWVTSGGASVGGAAPNSAVLVQIHTISAPTGGATLAGSAPDSHLYVQVVTIEPNGGVSVGGAAIVTDNIPFIPAGGAALGGEAVIQEVIPFTASGGVAAGGAGASAGVALIVPSGGAALGGAATPIAIYKPLPTGGARVGGAAPIDSYAAHVISGGVKLAGAATVTFADGFTFAPDGGVLIAGAAPVSFTTVNVYDIGTLDLLPQGGARLGGAATVLAAQAFVPAGGVEIDGAAVVGFIQPIVPLGGVEAGGTALAYFVASGASVTTENPYNEDFPGWAVNLETGAASLYLGMPANSLCQFGGYTYVANAGGIYKVGADDDAGQPIRAGIEIPQSDFGSERSKSIPEMYMGMRSSGKMRLSVLTKKGGLRHYYAVPKVDDELGAVRVKLGLGLEGRYWSERLENVDGCDFELESLAFSPVELTRHGR